MFDDRDLTEVATDRLEGELCELAAHVDAARCRWLLLVAEYERRGGHERWGCRSAAHWLNWKCGVSMANAWEQVRIARALPRLPAVTSAFSRGELSYSKVRALTRVAAPETEAELVELARHATAAQLDRLVRAYRGTKCRDEELAEANRRHDREQLSWYWDEDGSMVIKSRLDPEHGALWLAALEAARQACFNSPAGESKSVTQLAAFIVLLETALAAEPRNLNGAERNHLMVHVGLPTLRDDAPGPCAFADGPAIAPETARRLGCDATIVGVIERDGEIVSVGRATRSIPASLRRALWARDGGCRFPGCTNRAYADGHHVVFWTDGGETSLSNTLLFCRAHHRAVHEEGFRVDATKTDFVFYRPDGTLIEAVPKRPPVTGPALEAQNVQLGLAIDESTNLCRWDGIRMDYGLAVDALSGMERRAAS